MVGNYCRVLFGLCIVVLYLMVLILLEFYSVCVLWCFIWWGGGCVSCRNMNILLVYSMDLQYIVVFDLGV